MPVGQRRVLWGECNGNILPAYFLKATTTTHPPFFSSLLIVMIVTGPGTQGFTVTLDMQVGLHSYHMPMLDTSANSNPLSHSGPQGSQEPIQQLCPPHQLLLT